MVNKLTFALFLLIAAFLVPTSAQTGAATEKQLALKELGTLLNDKYTTGDFLEMLVTRMERFERETIEALLKERADLSPAEKDTLREALLDDAQAMNKRLPSRLSEKFDYNNWIGETLASVYDKHYTLEEIRELILFYKTATGQKTLRLTNTIKDETTEIVYKTFSPKIEEFLPAFREEDRKELEQKIDARKPKPKNKKPE